MVREYKARKLPVQQLLILSICRFAEPISLTSVFPYLPEMIESFGIPRNQVSKWAGVISAVFSLSQAVTGIAWGRASDVFGRKPVILVAMMCIMSTSVLFGFSRSLEWAIVSRSLAGASCGNVGIIRTMVAEMVPYKELQPKAFSVMPLVWTIGSIFGPGFGGALANPAGKYPKVFGEGGFFRIFPFALPNLVGAAFFLVGLSVGTLFLRETLETKKDKRDYGIIFGQFLLLPFTRENFSLRWSHREQEPASKMSLEDGPTTSRMSLEEGQRATKKSLEEESNPLLNHSSNAVPIAPPTYREVFSRQSNLNLLTYSILALHSLAYDQLLPIFMHYPQQTDRITNPDVHLPFKFTGGFGLGSDRIGLLFTVYGVVGMLIQFFVFPPFARRYGVLPCLKGVTAMFPIIYMITPFTALLPTPTAQQFGILIVMAMKCWAGIFAFPCTTILLTNSAVSLRILGTLNGVAVSISAIGRAVGPAIGGYTFTIGVEKGFGILPWWVLGCFGILGAIAPWWLVEMEGFGDNDGDSVDDETGQDEAILHNESEEEGRSTAILIGNEPLIEMGNDHNQFGVEGNTFGSETLSKTTSRSSGGVPFGSSLGRMSSPRRQRYNQGNGESG